MMYKRIPLMRVLKGAMLKIAEVQDALVLELSRKVDFIVHGGTAIWRIYGGKRFSYDVDVYCQDIEKIPEILSSALNVTRVKITPSRVLYLRVSDGAEVELEASPMFEDKEVIEEDFWLIDGSSIVVKTLSPCSLLEEKIRAYMNRRKARDLYDVYYLLDMCEDKSIRNPIKELLYILKSPPEDYPILKEIVLMGRPPSFETIVRKVERFAH